MRSIYLIKLELLLDFKIRIERVNLFELKFNLSITLILIKSISNKFANNRANYNN